MSKRIIIEVHMAGSQRPQLCAFDKERITVGRSYDCDLILTDDYVSREHMEISCGENDDEFIVTDLSSQNGSVANKKRIRGASQTITSGQKCLVGGTRLRVFSRAHEVSSARAYNWASRLKTMLGKPLVMFLILIAATALGVYSVWLESDPLNFMDKAVYNAVIGIVGMIAFLTVMAVLERIIGHKRAAITRQLGIMSLIMIGYILYDLYVSSNLYFMAPNMLIYHVIASCEVAMCVLLGGLFYFYVDAGVVRKKHVAALIVITLLIAGVTIVQSLGYSPTPQYPASILVTDAATASPQSLEQFLVDVQDVF